MEFSSSFLPRPYIMMISSINLSHILGFLGDVSTNWISMYFIKMLAYEGVILVPMAVPCIYISCC